MMSEVPSRSRLYPRSLKYLSDQLQGLIRGRLWLQVMIGMVAGIVLGIIIGPETGLVSAATAEVTSNWLAFPGQLFLAMIQMIVIPLVFASIVRGLAATEDYEQLRRVGLRVVIYFVLTTAVAIVIGLALALLIKPGNYVDSQALHATAEVGQAVQTGAAGISMRDLPQTFISILPSNPLTSMVESNTLEVVIFAVMIGVALVLMPPTQARPMLDLLGSLQEVCMTIVRWAMLLAPLAVFGLMVQLTARLGFEALLGMLVYVATVIAGLFLLLLMYIAILFMFTRESPLAFLGAVKEVILLAFSTSSSAAVMPLSIKVSEEKLGVHPSVSQFVIPLGATINMNGTALYQGVATIFLAQVYGVDIGIGGLALVVVTAVGASIGSPATPGVGIVILAMVLSSVGIPPSGVALLMGVDRILDMSRTALNVTGDLVAAKVMNQMVGGSTGQAEALEAEQAREVIRAETGEDVIIHRQA